MSDSRAKATRRELRRAVGSQAVAVLSEHTTAVQRLGLQLQALTERTDRELTAHWARMDRREHSDDRRSESWWRRWRWLLKGY